MSSILSEKNVILAIDYVIKDTDKKFDECLIDRFVEFLMKQVETERQCVDILELIKPILDRLKSYAEHKSFVMLNLARAFKVFFSVIKGFGVMCQEEFNTLTPYLDSFWGAIDIILINQNLAALTVMLEAYQHLLKQELFFHWLLEKQINPPVGGIGNITHLLKACTTSCNNYHTRNKAEDCFERLIVSSTRFINVDHQQLTELRQTIKDLIMDNSISILKIELRLAKRKYSDSILHHQYEFYDSFVQQLDKSVVSQEASNILCELLAITSRSIELRKNILNRLKSKQNLESLVVFVSKIPSEDPKFEKLALTYVMYPVIASCLDKTKDQETIKFLIRELVAAPDEVAMVDKNIKSMKLSADKFVTKCLLQLTLIFERSYKSSYSISKRFHNLVMQGVISYLRTYSNSDKSFKNLMQCCIVLKRLMDSYQNLNENRILIFKCLEYVNSVMKEIQIDSNQQKNLMIELVKVLTSSQRCYLAKAGLTYEDSKNFKKSYLIDILNFVGRFEDHDILNEFAILFQESTEILSRFEDDEIYNYVSLVWEMYQSVKQTDHRELLGNLAVLLIDIDLEVPARILERKGLRRHHEIPIVVGEILNEYNVITPTVEIIVNKLIETTQIRDSSIPKSKLLVVKDSASCATMPALGYLTLLESTKLPMSVKPSIDMLVKGLCSIIKGDISEATRCDTAQLLAGFTMELVSNYDATSYLLDRLTKTRVFDTFYELVTQYNMFYVIIGSITTIQTAIIKHLGEEDIANLKTKHSSAIVDFYLSDLVKERAAFQQRLAQTNEVVPRSIVDDILGYELLSDGIQDCY